jgi:acyl carrier protein
MRENIKEKIINEVELLASKKIESDDFEIFSNGYLDSLNVLHIIIFMESEFKIQINPYDISIDALSSINKITDFVLSKQ